MHVECLIFSQLFPRCLAARAYDAAVWQLKPYEVAKAYVNFKDECPVVPPPSQKAAKAAPSSKAPAAAGSSGAHVVMSL